MIDLHCHLLPGLDDGPATLEEALQMARLAVAGGITAARTTPHIHVARYDNELVRIDAAVAGLRAALEREAIPLELSAGAEVRLDYAILPLIEQDRVPFLGAWEGERVLLLEFPHSHVPAGAEKFIEWLRGKHIRPMIAHPERNKDVMRDLRKIEPFVAAGCLLQLTADAVAGAFGKRAAASARALLERGWVTLLASDAHDVRDRPPRMAPGRDAAAKIVGADEARRLTLDTPQRILGGAPSRRT